MKKTNLIIVTGLLIICCSFLISCKNTGVPENKNIPDKEGSNISDLVLIYHGSTHRPDWNTNQMKPYVYTDGESSFHWLFDGFLFLEIFDNIKGYEWDPGFGYKTAAKEQWEWLLDRYFGQGKGPDALEAILDSLSMKGKTPVRARKVIISIPCPVQGFKEWGDLDGQKIDFNKAEDQIAVACWFIDKTLDKWRKKNYKHIQLEGFYWVHESAGKDYAIIPKVKEYLKEKDMKLYWIPYWKAERAEQWSSLGFDLAYQQPNYFFSTKIPYQCLDDACHFANQHRMGMEMEFDNNIVKPEKRSRYYDYIKSFEANGVWASRQVAYYEGGGAWLKMSESNDPEIKKMVKTLSDIIIVRQEMVDKNSIKK
ncbi:MAG: DUF4855 domain-containing protein [Bacteroidales bacterium]|nr:DUF4855 domain-containing protein [Bacteroidales bacterium]